MKELHKITVGYLLQKWDFQTKEYLDEFVEEQEPSYESIDFGKANNE